MNIWSAKSSEIRDFWGTSAPLEVAVEKHAHA